MGCNKPFELTYKDELNNEKTILAPCRKCLGCRIERAKNWSIKLIKEKLYHKEACFVTLTFDTEELLKKTGKSNINFLQDVKNSHKYFQDFIKRLRKKNKDKHITYFHVGEYGEKFGRPHHHIIIYGYMPKDLKLMSKSKSGYDQYHSDEIKNLWKIGRISIEYADNNTIKYVANYTVKKIKKAEGKKPYFTYSNRGRIGYKYANRFAEEIIKNGNIKDQDNFVYKIPKTFYKYWEKIRKDLKEKIDKLKMITEEYILEHEEMFNEEARERKEEVLKYKLNLQKPRDYK